jgi:hypothetical protein
MKNKNSICFLVLLPSIAWVQNTFLVSKQVFDSQDKKVLPYTAISVKNTKIATYSDEQGIFNINCKESDTLQFSSVGYRIAEIPLSKILNKDSIFLNQSNTMLGEIVITNDTKKTKTEWIGYAKKKASGTYIGFQETAVWIENPYKTPLSIMSIRSMIEKRRIVFASSGELLKNKKILVRLRLYAKNLLNLPSNEDILTENLIAEVDVNQKEINFDMRNLAMTLPKNGVFVSLEFLGVITENNEFISYEKLSKIEKQQFQIKLTKVEIPESFARDLKGNWTPTVIRGNFRFGIQVAILEQ